MAVTDHVGHQARTKIPSEVDSIARLPAKAGANTKDNEEEPQWCKWSSAEISVVLEGVDEEHQQRAGNEFGEELASLGHERCRIGAEDASGRSVASDCADARASLKDIDRRLVVAIDNRSGAHGSQNLGYHVDREFAPWKFAKDAVGKSDSRIEVSPREAACVDAQHDSKTGAYVRPSLHCEEWRYTHPQPHEIDW